MWGLRIMVLVPDWDWMMTISKGSLGWRLAWRRREESAGTFWDNLLLDRSNRET